MVGDGAGGETFGKNSFVGMRDAAACSNRKNFAVRMAAFDKVMVLFLSCFPDFFLLNVFLQASSEMMHSFPL